MKKLMVLYHKQSTEYTCGPASLRMVFRYFGRRVSEQTLAKRAHTSRAHGTSNQAMINAVRQVHLYCYAKKNATIREIKQFIRHGLPVILNYRHSDDEGHYAVVIGYTPTSLLIHDPYDRKSNAIKIRTLMRTWWDVHNNKRSARWLMAVSPTPLDLIRSRRNK